MRNEIVTKVNKIGKAGEIISNICKVFLAIGAIACLVSGILLKVMPDDLLVIHMDGKATSEINTAGVVGMGMGNEHGQSVVLVGTSGALELNGVEYGVTNTTATDTGFIIEAEAEPYSLRMSQLASTVFLAAITCAVMWIVMHFISKLCTQFKECETPFTEEISNVLRKLAFAVGPLVVIGSMFDSALDGMANGQFNVVIHLDLVMVVMVVLILMLSSIFRYGAMLQQESDETL